MKSVGLGSTRWWSYAEEWEHHVHELQSLPPRHCYAKHKIQGGMIRLLTVEIELPWEMAGVTRETFERYASSVRFGEAFVVPRSEIEALSRQRQMLPAQHAAAPAREPETDGIASAEPPVRRREPAPPAQHDVPVTVAQTPLHRELLAYLEHIAQQPFLPALRRDEALGLTRYKSASLRQQLVDAGWIRMHRVNTGRRSGQLLLQELTPTAHEMLASMRVRVAKPRGRGGFLHKYYCHRLAEFATATWPNAKVLIEDATRGRPVDVGVLIPSSEAGRARSIAFEVFVTGEAKEVAGIAQDVALFDQVIACAADPQALASLRRRVEAALPQEALDKVSFSTVSRYMVMDGEVGEGSRKERPSTRARAPRVPVSTPSRLKRRAGSEPEPEGRERAPAKRGRKPKPPLLRQVEDAFAHFHDWDVLAESPLAELPEVRQHVRHLDVMPEAAALHRLLDEAARLVVRQVDGVPSQAEIGRFLERYLEGMRISDIARELGVTREWCSRHHRKQATGLVALQFMRLVSSAEDATSI